MLDHRTPLRGGRAWSSPGCGHSNEGSVLKGVDPVRRRGNGEGRDRDLNSGQGIAARRARLAGDPQSPRITRLPHPGHRRVRSGAVYTKISSGVRPGMRRAAPPQRPFGPRWGRNGDSVRTQASGSLHSDVGMAENASPRWSRATLSERFNPPVPFATKAMKRDFLGVLDAEKDFIAILELAANLKNRTRAGELYEPLRNKNLAMIFEKASTRTRVSFEVAMAHLGGHALYLNPQDLQLGRGETIADTARVLSGYVDAIVYRAYRHADVVELAKWTTVPVINGLDDLEHPCQALADLFTVLEHKGELKGLRLAYVGDGNNVCNSLLAAAALVGMDMAVP